MKRKFHLLATIALLLHGPIVLAQVANPDLVAQAMRLPQVVRHEHDLRARRVQRAEVGHVFFFREPEGYVQVNHVADQQNVGTTCPKKKQSGISQISGSQPRLVSSIPFQGT